MRLPLYQNQYSDPDLPPIWSVCEVMSLGLLSRWYKNLRPMSTRSKIAGTYNLDNMILQSFIHHLTEIRNICAHHSRLWNRKFTVIFQLPRNPLELSKNFNQQETRRLYNTLVMLVWFLNRISPEHSWDKKLIKLIQQHEIQVFSMGFPENYESLLVWKKI